ncbi:glycoside hydrolase family 13 protein [Microbacterium sp.]|uniref:glycoside hydrolase family 13 protein n=1 Tax=Microbacterium sp. TaxID=51671 RepID=UPI0033402CEE
MKQPATPRFAPAHHDGSPLYVSTSAPSIGDGVELRVRVSRELEVVAVHARSTPDGEPRFDLATPETAEAVADEIWWRVRVPVVNPELSYRFVLQTPGGALWLTAAGLSRTEVTDDTDFLISTAPPAPSWSDGAVVYEIFLDRFARSEAWERPALPEWADEASWTDRVPWGTERALQQVYGGDLHGVVERLDHLVALGVDVIYLTPFFPSRSNHRYDSTTFSTVDPLLGGDDGLRRLTDAAHARGMRVIGDITLNHSGDGHEWFRRALADPGSAERDFYFIDPDDESYASFCGVPTLPTFDHRSSELRARLYDGEESVIRRGVRDWGLDGWRVDVAQSAGRHGTVELNDLVARRTRGSLDPGHLLLAENQFDASRALRGEGWHGTMSYAGFSRPVWSWLARERSHEFWGTPGPIPQYTAADVRAVMTMYSSRIPWRSYSHNLTLIDSHDTARFRSIAGADRQLLAAALMFALPGIPMVFAGDEVGVEGVHLEDGRRPFPWDPEEWDPDAWSVYRELIALRRGHEALRTGGLRWLHASDDVLIFERASETGSVLVLVARDAHEPLTSPVDGASLIDGDDLVAGAPIPGEGARFGIWEVSR